MCVCYVCVLCLCGLCVVYVCFVCVICVNVCCVYKFTHISALVNLQFINVAISKTSLIHPFLGLWLAFSLRSNTSHDG